MLGAGSGLRALPAAWSSRWVLGELWLSAGPKPTTIRACLGGEGPKPRQDSRLDMGWGHLPGYETAEATEAGRGLARPPCALTPLYTPPRMGRNLT